jgi:hypothetical protein
VYNNTATGVYFPDHHQSQPAFARLRRVRPLRTCATARVYGQDIYYAPLRGNLLQQPWAVYPESFLAVGGFAEDVRYCEDWERYTRLTRRFPVALSDRVILYHHVEGENLHLHAGQERMHVKALYRLLADAGWLRPRARWVIRRRLGVYHKTAGDHARARSLGEEGRLYLRSLWSWPFDHVVVARTLWWPFRMLLGKGGSPTRKN